jgi:hypothetical protein
MISEDKRGREMDLLLVEQHFRSIRTRQQVRYECLISTPNGDVRWYDFVYSPIFDDQDKVVGGGADSY